MAGLSCADALARDGIRVSLFDKGRGPGGRMSSRRLETPLGAAVFDFGAQYFIARDKAFAAQVQAWEAKGVVTRWPAARPNAYIGTPTMNAILRYATQQHDVTFSTLVKGLKRHGRHWQLMCEGHDQVLFDSVVLALPAEQTAPILTLHDFELAQAALFARSQPCWTGMFAFAERLAHDKGIIRDSGIIAWAARDNAKPGRSGPERWVVQAAPQWSTSHLEHTTDSIAPHLLKALSAEIGASVAAPIAQSIHRWRYGLSAGTGLGCLWNPGLRLGACGDWLLGPSMECAWLSGKRLAERIVAAAPIAAQ